MKWLSIIWQMLVPAGVAIYTVNFGRWLASRQNRSGAYLAYFLAVLAFGLTLVVLLRNNITR